MTEEQKARIVELANAVVDRCEIIRFMRGAWEPKSVEALHKLEWHNYIASAEAFRIAEA